MKWEVSPSFTSSISFNIRAVFFLSMYSADNCSEGSFVHPSSSIINANIDGFTKLRKIIQVPAELMQAYSFILFKNLSGYRCHTTRHPHTSKLRHDSTSLIDFDFFLSIEEYNFSASALYCKNSWSEPILILGVDLGPKNIRRSSFVMTDFGFGHKPSPKLRCPLMSCADGRIIPIHQN